MRFPLTPFPAEFRGPGVHHNFDDSDDHADPSASFPDPQRNQPIGMSGYNGRVIFLGDGTEVVTNSSPDADMVDVTDEDKDLESQVSKGEKKEGGGEGEKKGDEGAKEEEAKDTPKAEEKGEDAKTG